MRETTAAGTQKPQRRLLVGTVFTDASDLQRRWFDLQHRFLEQTTAQYDHVTFMSDGTDPQAFAGATTILRADGPRLTSNVAHAAGLTGLLHYFRERRASYDNFLFIDSDAFPIRQGWMDIILERMGARYEIAAVIRSENLETRLHASVLFARRVALDHLSFEVGRAGLDLTGNDEVDVTVPSYQHERRSRAFGLLRSNRLNLHPLLCGVYYDLFYHQGAGSGRAFQMRAQPYWRHMADMYLDPFPFTQQLFDDPSGFVDRLTWPAFPMPEQRMDDASEHSSMSDE